MKLKLRQLQVLFILFSVIIVSCGRYKPTSEEVKKSWGKFENGQTIKYRLVDLQRTPIYKKISENGVFREDYKFLDSVNIYSIIHLSDGLYITGFIVTPKKEGKYPCLIFNRGGNRDLGSLIVFTAVEFMAPIATKGYVIAATNYRGSPGCEGKDEFGGNDVNDLLNLMNSLSEIPQSDTSSIGMYGISRGGMMTYIAASRTKKLKAVAVVGGISDLFILKNDRPEFEKEVFNELIPNYSEDKDNSLKQRSATHFTDKICKTTSILLLHGENDEKVSVEQSKLLDKKLTELNYPHKLIVFANDNHGLQGNQEESIDEIIKWFNKYLK